MESWKAARSRGSTAKSPGIEFALVMQHVLSTHLFVNQRLTAAGLDRVRGAGFWGVEIFCARQHLDYYDKAQINELGYWFRDSELAMHSLHARCIATMCGAARDRMRF